MGGVGDYVLQNIALRSRYNYYSHFVGKNLGLKEGRKLAQTNSGIKPRLYYAKSEFRAPIQRCTNSRSFYEGLILTFPPRDNVRVVNSS